MKISLPQDSFFQSHFKPIYEAQNVQLFELTNAAFDSRISNLLQNPGFEKLQDNRPIGWELAGTPVVDKSGKYSFSGSVAVYCYRAGDVIYQTVSVSHGEHYLLSWKARAGAPAQAAKLQINWTDDQGILLKEDISTVEVGSDWRGYDIGLQAPKRAVRATVYISPLDPSSVWFDDLSFGQTSYQTSQ